MAEGYGIEIWNAGTMQTGRFARGPMVVAQAAYRRLTTPRGTLRGGEDESRYGLDVAGYVGAMATDTVLAAMPGMIRAELLKDDRIVEVDVKIETLETAPGMVELRFTVRATLDDEASDFALTFSVANATAILLGVQVS